MKRTASAMMLLAMASGCMSSGGGGNGTYMSNAFNNNGGCEGTACGAPAPREMAGVQGPWGQPVAVNPAYAGPSNMTGAEAAKAAIAQSMHPDSIQRASFNPGSCANGSCQQAMMFQGGPGPMPPGLPQMPGMPGMPGMAPPGAVAGMGALTGGPQHPFAVQRTEVRFNSPADMKVSWYAPSATGKGGFSSTSLSVPGKYNFVQGGIYRLKLSDVANHPGVPYFPTLEVVPSNNKTATFLAHSAVPVSFTQDDFEQVAAGNYVVKVIYLPDRQYQDLAATGPDEVVSSRLEPGVDPIAEACRRGSILLIVRLGNIDLELDNSPPMFAPNPYLPRPMPRRGGIGLMGPHGMMMPPGGPGQHPPTDLPGLLPPPPDLQTPPALPSGENGPTGKLNITPADQANKGTGTSWNGRNSRDRNLGTQNSN